MSQNASYSPPYNIPMPGATSVYGQGGGYLISGARSISDAKRQMQAGFVPTAQYPSGYLGTINSRREDRVLGAVNRATQKSFQRGVHKGERVDPADYYWTDQVNPTVALQAQARGRKWTQRGSFVGSKLVDEGNNLAAISTPERFATGQMAYASEMEPPFVAGDDERRRAQQSRLLPRWS